MNHLESRHRLPFPGPSLPGRNRPWVVLDRDGTLVRECHYLCNPDQLELLPGVVPGLRMLLQHGVPVAVVTNQSAVGRGLLDHAQLGRIHARLDWLLQQHGVRVHGIYYCPHRPEDRCRCRKPAPGLLEEAAGDLGLDPARAIVVGDKPCDVELALAVGATGVLVRTGYGAQYEQSGYDKAHLVADDLHQVARWFLARTVSRSKAA